MPEYAVVVPTFNEKGNVTELARRLKTLLAPLDWELIFVDDDSQDGTLEELSGLAKQDFRIRYIRRVGRRGLASACVEGMLSTTATYIAVMDADLQHDETRLPEIFALLASGEANLVVGSRYMEDGSVGNWDTKRIGMSKLATWLASKCLHVPCTDPMSGFFGLHRALIDQSAREIQTRGFKILFDLLTQPKLTLEVREVPYVFKERQHGKTKLRFSILLDFLWLLLSKYIGSFIYIEFLMFCLVGFVGVGVHLGTLFIVYRVFCSSFLIGQGIATLVAMTSNYVLNNMVTFREKKLVGKKYMLGYGKFVAGCAFGALANIAVADFLNRSGIAWFVAACTGVAAGAFINFFFAKFFIWKKIA
jgi:dolichol-phosphate mannosyltransferase